MDKEISFVVGNKFKGITINVKYGGYDLQIIIEYEMKNGKITKYDVWTTAPDYCIRFYSFGGDTTLNSDIKTLEEVIDLVYANFECDNIGFDEIIEAKEND